MRWLVVLLAALLLGGCAEPSRDYPDYQNKVAHTAEAMIGIIDTARLAGAEWLDGDVMGAYADTVVSHAESDAGSVVTAIDTRQPPDEASMRLKDQVDQPLTTASGALTDLRIALRRSDRQGVEQALKDLDKPLQQFQQLKRIA